jgi:hypothetical protein
MRSSELLPRSLSLAVARYLHDRPEAAESAEAWRDDEVERWMTRPVEDIQEDATDGLEALEEWADEVREDAPEEWEEGRVDYLQAQLNFQSARSGSFGTAAGGLADFLADMGEDVDVLEEH